MLRQEYPPALVAAALTQIELRERARAKFAHAERMYFTRAGLEQASSERTAEHRARRYAGLDRIADLCCGIGGDLVALAAGRSVLAVDRDPVHLRLATLNADATDLKEAALWSPALATVARRATILPQGHTLVASAGDDVRVAAPGGYLIDPNPAVTRAGLVEELARLVGAWKIDQQIAFLSS